MLAGLHAPSAAGAAVTPENGVTYEAGVTVDLPCDAPTPPPKVHASSSTLYRADPAWKHALVYPASAAAFNPLKWKATTGVATRAFGNVTFVRTVREFHDRGRPDHRYGTGRALDARLLHGPLVRDRRAQLPIPHRPDTARRRDLQGRHRGESLYHGHPRGQRQRPLGVHALPTFQDDLVHRPRRSRDGVQGRRLRRAVLLQSVRVGLEISAAHRPVRRPGWQRLWAELGGDGASSPRRDPSGRRCRLRRRDGQAGERRSGELPRRRQDHGLPAEPWLQGRAHSGVRRTDERCRSRERAAPRAAGRRTRAR